jgi:hypothetical protein
MNYSNFFNFLKSMFQKNLAQETIKQINDLTNQH